MNPDFLKKAGYLAFACAFLMALRIFGQVGSWIMTRDTAILLFMLFGAFGFILNLINRRKIEKQRHYHLLFWMGSSITLIGYGMTFLHVKYHLWIIGIGMTTIFASFFFPENKDSIPSEDFLDDETGHLS